jgi:hypothetical protein
MKGLTKWIILAIFLIFCVQAVSAYSIASMSITPSGSLVPSTPVKVAFKINNAGNGPDSPDLLLSTDLSNAVWTYSIIVDGVETPEPVQSGQSLDITGFLISYKTSQEVDAQISLAGVAPSVTETMNKTIISVAELDTSGSVVAGSAYSVTTQVVNTAEVTQAITAAKSNLQAFQSLIAENTTSGIDTSASQTFYNTANQDINSAAQLPSAQYTEAYNDLTAAQNAINAGETALDKAWAENIVANAQVPINNVDTIIAWFKGNTSTANDQQLSSIVAQREVAVSYLSTATQDISNGNFEEARTQAQDAFAQGNESYTNALAEQYKVMHGVDPLAFISGIIGSGVTIIVVGVVVVVLIIVGVIIYRKRSRWDELG